MSIISPMRICIGRGQRLTWLVALHTVALLGGCRSFYAESAITGAGITGAAIASKVTENAAVATGIGLGAVAIAKAGVQYSEREVHRHTQNRVALAAGALDVGAVAPWSVSHSIPLEDDEHGSVTVSRRIGYGSLDCKEIVFSVDPETRRNEGATRAFFVAAICRDGDVWRWASAEPATERWGALQ